MADKTYRWIGDYARDIEGQTLAPGDFIDLDKTKVSDETRELIDNGSIIDTAPSSGGTHSTSGSTVSDSDKVKGGKDE